jgi:hypothetical protein
MWLLGGGVAYGCEKGQMKKADEVLLACLNAGLLVDQQLNGIARQHGPNLGRQNRPDGVISPRFDEGLRR